MAIHLFWDEPICHVVLVLVVLLFFFLLFFFFFFVFFDILLVVDNNDNDNDGMVWVCGGCGVFLVAASDHDNDS